MFFLFNIYRTTDKEMCFLKNNLKIFEVCKTFLNIQF